VTATFMTETGASVGRTYVVPATSRLTIALSSVPELADTSFGTVLTSNAPITAERALYFGAPLTGGHTSEGTPAPSTRWLLAEGATGPFFEMYLLLLNPNPTPATVRITYRTDTGATILRTRVVGPRARTTIAVRDEDPLLRSAAVWTAVDADLPIVSERSMYWPGALDSWSDGHNTVGASQPATKWGFAEGASGGPLGFDAYYLMANPGAADATVTLTFLPESGSPVVRTLTVPAGSRVTWAASQVPDLAGRGFGVVLTSTAPIVAERSMYWSAGGAPFSGGASASAVRVPR
jgi:hypothetical protein